MVLSRRIARVSTLVVLLTIVLSVTVLSACGQPDPVSRSASPSPTTASLKSTWTAVSRLQVPLVDTVVLNSPGFTTAERTYLVRSNVTWDTIQNACSDYGTQSSSAGVEQEKVLALSIDDTTSLWLKMKAPSSRFAAFHKQTQRLMGRLQELSRLTRKHALATDEQAQGDLAGKVAAASSPGCRDGRSGRRQERGPA